MITENYVSFETAQLLKNKGFDWCCGNSYLDEKGVILFPKSTLQMAMKWLRDVHQIFIEVGYNRFYGTYNVHVFSMVEQQDDTYKLPVRFNNYEESCEAAIKYVLENLI